MIVISDTSPLRYLVETGLVHILETLFGKVLIPQAVFDELQHPKTPQKVKDWISDPPPSSRSCNAPNLFSASA